MAILKNPACRKRAARTFLQTACGMLAAQLTAAVTDLTEHQETWKTGLLTLIAASIAGGIAAVMNKEERKDEQKGD